MIVESNFHCSVCSKYFSTQSNLNVHAKKCGSIHNPSVQDMSQLQTQIRELAAKVLSLEINPAATNVRNNVQNNVQNNIQNETTQVKTFTK